MSDVTLRAQVLAEALPYIQKYYGKTIVIKYGGSAMISRELREAVIGDVILLSLVGIHVVVVHGGGPEISAMLKKLGKESRFVDGLRCTDTETMDVVQQVLCGKVNKNLAATLNRRGGRAIGLCGLDAGLFQARLLDAKYGLVGELARVDPAPVRDCLTAGYIPVVSTVAQGVDGETPTTSTPTRLPPGWRWLWGQRSSSSSPTCAACCGIRRTRAPFSRRWACPRCPCWCGRGSSREA